MGNKRVYALDYIRVIAMLGVIMIHVSSGYILSNSKIALGGMNMGFIFNQAARFAVPAFVVLSGASLGLGRSYESYGGFILSRLKKIGLPYLFWSMVYCYYNYDSSLTEMIAKGPGFWPAFFHDFITGGFASHLYFIVVIMQLYLLYPLLKKMKARFGIQLLLASFILSFFFHFALYLTSFGHYILPGWLQGYAWLLAPTWLVYFVGGLFITTPVIERVSDFTAKNKGLLFGFTLLFLFFFAWESLLTGSFEISVKPQVFAYVPLVMALTAGFAKSLRNVSWLNKVVAVLSACSMTVYFCHVRILYYFRQYLIFSRGMVGMVLLYGAVAGSSILFALFIYHCKKVIFGGKS